MKRLLTIGVLAVAGLAVGCSSGKDNKQAKAPDYAPQPAPPLHDPGMPIAQVGTPAGGGVVTTAGMDLPAPGPKLADPAPARGTKYVVKKGDTLWSIAAKTYNDGQQWKKIRAANPSIKGEQVLVGQTIILP
ncbi:MAG: LysM peptidoglycan-binding domain-containing protein [Tepidisphaerales bacterium]